MKERPILFSGPMAGALLEGRKTQTRRVVKPQPYLYHDGGDYKQWMWDAGEEGLKAFSTGGRTPTVWNFWELFCPYGAPGDLLWVRETWGEVALYSLDTEGPQGYQTIYRADRPDIFDTEFLTGGRWRPSIHMPRWASRITLRVTGVRVERVQDISEADSWAEGFPDPDGSNREYSDRARYWYRHLWDSINGAKPGASWQANPWVWIVEFERVAEEPTR